MDALDHVFGCVVGCEHGRMWNSHCAHANVLVCVLAIVYTVSVVYLNVCLLRLRDQPIFCLCTSPEL